jgi:hypothetical protein
MLPTPASTSIDRLYVEAGFYVIGGANLRINQKEQRSRLWRDNDYPSLLNAMIKHFVAFYDVEDHKAWLIDGASALLHLVRVSLHLDETDPESTYDWQFDRTKLVDNWPGYTGRHAARKTLTHWDNLALPVYVRSQSGFAGAIVKQYSTLQDRVEKILHSLEILVDLQAHNASSEGIKISQSKNLHKAIGGFDILDFLKPLGPIGTRIKRFDSWGDGWMDLLPTAGVVTLFGKGFGELIRPDNPKEICPTWHFIPNGEDYLISTVSTLKLLQRNLGTKYSLPEKGDLTDKISWRSSPHSCNSCKCAELGGGGKGRRKCPDPAHFMVSKSSSKNWNAKDLIPVDINVLDPDGAVVFANLSLTGQRTYAKKTKGSKTEPGNAVIPVPNPVLQNLRSSMASTSASTAGLRAPSTEATNSTELTEVSSRTTSQGPVKRPQSKGISKTKKLKDALVSFFKRSPS